MKLHRIGEASAALRLQRDDRIDEGRPACYYFSSQHCFAYRSQPKQPEIVLLDRWWTEDYAANWCKMGIHSCSPNGY